MLNDAWWQVLLAKEELEDAFMPIEPTEEGLEYYEKGS